MVALLVKNIFFKIMMAVCGFLNKFVRRVQEFLHGPFSEDQEWYGNLIAQPEKDYCNNIC